MENVIKVEISGDIINLHPKSSPAWKSVWLNNRLGSDYILDLKAIMIAISQRHTQPECRTRQTKTLSVYKKNPKSHKHEDVSSMTKTVCENKSRACSVCLSSQHWGGQTADLVTSTPVRGAVSKNEGRQFMRDTPKVVFWLRHTHTQHTELSLPGSVLLASKRLVFTVGPTLTSFTLPAPYVK